MALMLEKTYDAFREAGASEEKARAASTEIAGYESAISELRSDMKLVKWMLGSNIAMTLLLLGLALRHL
jgi:hypothetical protein